jgi:hypothetical protein
MKKEKTISERHVNLAVGCPKSLDHGGFYIDTDRHKIICEKCEEDITAEFKEIRDSITKQLKRL